MTTFNTGNAVGSTDPRDLYDNAENLDKLVNGIDPLYSDRKGKLRESWAGMENSFTNAQEGRETAFELSQSDKESRFQAFLVSSGYASKGDYAAGVVLAERNEYVAVDAATTGTSAGMYRPNASAALPLTLTGTWETDSRNLVLIGDGALRQELATSAGSEKVGYGSGTVRDALDSLSRKASEVISIQDYGAVDDFDGSTGTDALPAIQAILTQYPDGATIRMPRTGTGRYLINGGQSIASLDGFVLDPDDGVSIYQIGGPSPLIAKGIRVTRELEVRLADAGFTFYLGPQAYKPTVEAPGFMSWADGEEPALFSVNQTGTRNIQIPWPDGPVTTATPSVVAADAVVWSPVPSNAFVLTTKPVRPGSEITAYLSVPAYAGILAAGVVTDAGFSIVRQDASGGAVQTAVKSGSAAIVESAGIATPMQSLDSYRMALGLISVRVHSARSYSVLVNGVELVRVKDAGGVILQAGFGGGFVTNSGSLTVAGMSVAKNVRAMGVQPLKVVVVGDSITDAEVPASWVDYMRQYVSGVGGAQFAEIRNLAVSGENSNQQNAKLLASDIAGFNYCLIQVGVNDIQQGFSPANLTTNLGTMIDYCHANGVTPIVGVPTMFYPSSEAAPYGNTGQSTANSSGGAPYRATVLRYLAGRGVAVARTLEGSGAILPSLLGNAALDPVVMDNIHPTAYGRMLIGFSFAKALLAQIQPRINKTVEDRPAPASWALTGFGATSLPSYAVQDDMFMLAGALSVVTDPVPAGTAAIQLPEIFAPQQQATFVIPTAGAVGTPSGSAFAIVAPSGVMTLYNVPAGARYLYLGSVRFPIGS